MNLSLAINDLRFNLLSYGPEKGPFVLFLHGFPEFADAWLPILEAVGAAGYRAVAFDQRGYSAGARPQKVEDYAMTHLTADVLAVGSALGAEQFHLVGHDWGGLLAWQIAADHPERLRSLTVLSTQHTAAFLHAAKTDLDQMNRSKYIPFFKMPGHLAEAYLLSGNAEKLGSLYGGRLSPAQLEANLHRLRQPGALTAALNWYRALP